MWTPKPLTPVLIYPYSIGDLKMQTKTVLYSSIRPDETLGEKISVKNEGKTTLTIHPGKVPHFLTVEVRPTQLAPDEVGEITLLLDAKATKKKRPGYNRNTFNDRKYRSERSFRRSTRRSQYHRQLR